MWHLKYVYMLYVLYPVSLFLDFEAVQIIAIGEGHAFTASFSKDGVFLLRQGGAMANNVKELCRASVLHNKRVWPLLMRSTYDALCENRIKCTLIDHLACHVFPFVFYPMGLFLHLRNCTTNYF